MKYPGLLIFGLLLFFSCHSRLHSQAKPETVLDKVTQTDNTVRFQLTSSAPFIMGDNYYVLCIGAQAFDKYEMKQDGKVKYLNFLLTADEFSSLQEGVPMYLTYGLMDPTEQDMELLASQTKICWSLGTFSSTLLK